jgi:hypothetical protein
MTLFWTMIAIWLCFATLLPIYVLFKAMFPPGSPTPNAYPHGSCAASKRGMGGVMITVAADLNASKQRMKSRHHCCAGISTGAAELVIEGRCGDRMDQNIFLGHNGGTAGRSRLGLRRDSRRGRILLTACLTPSSYGPQKAFDVQIVRNRCSPACGQSGSPQLQQRADEVEPLALVYFGSNGFQCRLLQRCHSTSRLSCRPHGASHARSLHAGETYARVSWPKC